MSARLPGRQFFANPGPTNIPDSVLREMSRQTVDFMGEDFVELYDRCVAGLKRVVGTTGDVFFYTASGHGAWEATLVNLFSPGDVLLVVETGVFSESWAAMMAKHGLVVRTVAADWRGGVEYGRVEAALREDAAGEIRAVCCVHNETSTGMVLDLPAVRRAMDAAGHGALLLADSISSLGCLEFRMDEWGVDAAV
ncbi:MAG: pyridoxal-phosphate-dependent aminotransferase family protein, partial [Janthinobacterium lividum]